MSRLGVTVTKQMQDALSQESEKTGAPISALVRMAVEEFLTSRGYEINADVSWGGHRKPKPDDTDTKPD